jgi:hypothetical protein
MKHILFALLLTCSLVAKAQVFNNEWIDYSKTYYKFKVGRNGIVRISQSTLSAAGLSNTPAEHFQLWRHGVQVPIYTSVASGSLPAGGYIEFWGQMNDGRADNQLYRAAFNQLNDKWSLSTDTSTYFLTVNTTVSANLRLATTANNVAGNTLPAEPYFMHTVGRYYREKINAGYAVNVGEYMYSSSYDKGEGWSSLDMGKNASVSATFSNLFVFAGGPAPKFRIATSGNAYNYRRYRANINGDSVLGNSIDFFATAVDSINFPLSLISGGEAAVSVTNQTFCSATSCPNSDRMVVHKFEITYPRQFNFDGATSFEFSLEPSATGSFLQIANFSYGSTAPVLYDLTNGKRYVADLSAAPQLRFVLEPSAQRRNLVLVSQETATMTAISGLETRNFINYASPAHIGNYLIISHPNLFAGNNPVEQYRAYRSSAAGGSFNAKIYLSDELIDQFGFGIKKHPAAIRNFIRWARLSFPAPVKYVFIIGKGVHYLHQRTFESASNPADQENLAKLNLVPTFGWPASDVLLTAEPGSSVPEIPIGRLSAISPQEVTTYLDKIKEFELAQQTGSPRTADRGWMKNIVHIIGASDDALGSILSSNMSFYERVIRDTLYGGRVSTFTKASTDAVEQLNSAYLTTLFNEGISLITYFGHSSATTLEFNLDNPENYNNQGKYPLFIGLGCNAGNFYNYNPLRFQTKETISEKYVLAPNRGTIGFVASSHFGIVHYLDIWAQRAYRRMSVTSYGKSIGEIMKQTIQDVFNTHTQEDFYARANAEETQFHGDPAITLNPHPKPDYVIEDPMVRVTPGFISVADASFKVDARFLNIGRAPLNRMVVEVKREYPNGSTSIIRRDTIQGTRYMDSITVNIPITSNDKGLNKIIVKLDADEEVEELYETNNQIVKDVFIYEDEARPVYPYNFAIINRQNIKLIASTANPFSQAKPYRMEIDTTELFNSPFKRTREITSPGGTMEFDPGLTFSDSTVYYWRVAPVPTSGPLTWNTASFVYLANSDVGFNQSHVFQHFKSGGNKLSLDSASRNWQFGQMFQNIFIRTGTWATSVGQEAGVSVAINSSPFIRNSCWYQCVTFNVFNPVSFKAMRNITLTPNNVAGGLFGSGSNNCFAGREFNFEFRWDSVSNRKRAMDFMRDHIPDGSYVVVRSFLLDPNTFPGFAPMLKYAAEWRADTAVHGSGQSLYHYLKQAGLATIDSFNRPRQFVLVYKKNDPSFTPRYLFSDGTYDNPTLSVDCPTSDTLGYITSPKFGPARSWKEFRWAGRSLDNTAGDNPIVKVLGHRPNGQVDTLFNDIHAGVPVISLASVNAAQYPYLQLQMRNIDTAHYTPYQLRYWRFTYDPAPEGAIAPNAFWSMKDTVEVAEPLQFKVAFKNVSEVPFPDSVKVKLVVTDRNNVRHVLPPWKQRALPVNDTLHVRYPVDTRQLVGNNLLYVEVNPDNDQPEQYHFNNFFYKNFYVRGDTLNPLLDVTFDNVRILNRDIVSAKPNIMIKLKDEAKWFTLNDTATVSVQVRFPDNSLHSYRFDGATMQFVPAAPPPNSDNTATVNLRPLFDQDGEYELIVQGRDMSNNQAGRLQYRVLFQVINKPMISNMLNYPNPFTTSTAFVFTVTGSEVPQNIKIQIMTVTGKIVREITKDELGPIHIGRNITEFKWDGTDQYGQKLANGVYLYRVVTNLNGKSLDKYRSEGENTDKFFNKGYGKMYLMR